MQRASRWTAALLMLALGRASADTPPEPVSTPLVLVGAGTSLDGAIASAAVGWAWGEHEHGLFEGSQLVRVLADAAYHPGASSVALTVGWYRTSVIDLGFDAGVEARRHEAGPTLRITVGVYGITARFGAAALFDGDGTNVAGTAEVVLDVMELAHRI